MSDIINTSVQYVEETVTGNSKQIMGDNERRRRQKLKERELKECRHKCLSAVGLRVWF